MFSFFNPIETHFTIFNLVPSLTTSIENLNEMTYTRPSTDRSVSGKDYSKPSKRAQPVLLRVAGTCGPNFSHLIGSLSANH